MTSIAALPGTTDDDASPALTHALRSGPETSGARPEGAYAENGSNS
jgi:hypothetical protein